MEIAFRLDVGENRLITGYIFLIKASSCKKLEQRGKSDFGFGRDIQPCVRNSAEIMKFIWSEYIRHRAESRKFDLGKIEEILRYSAERYFDTETDRLVAVGRHDERLITKPTEIR